jgi:hypothetical protein
VRDAVNGLAHRLQVLGQVVVLEESKQLSGGRMTFFFFSHAECLLVAKHLGAQYTISDRYW